MLNNICLSLFVLTASELFLFAQTNIIFNGGFESGTAGWGSFWSRTPNSGNAIVDSGIVHSGKSSLQINHTADADWSFNWGTKIPVKSGEWYEYEGWFRVEGEGDVILCVITYATDGKVQNWAYAEQRAQQNPDWVHLKSRFIIPQNIGSILPRIIGHGKITARADDISLKRITPPYPTQSQLPDKVSASNRFITFSYNTKDCTFSVYDNRSSYLWQQKQFRPETVTTRAVADGKSINIGLYHIPSGLDITAIITADRDKPEILIEIKSEDAMPQLINFPHPFATAEGTYLVVPMNEGISYPVDDTSIEPMRLVGYGGHGICMAFWGVTDGKVGQMSLIETADDMSLRIDRLDGKLVAFPSWEAQKQKFGYTRSLRYIFFDKGGYVAMCKRYREYARKIGRLKTLEEKRRENPSVDLLIGAVNVWCWEKDAPALVKEMQEAGIERILWSNAQPPENIKKLNELGVLTSRYDIYQDIMNPENFKYLRGVHSDWPTEAWPNDIIIDAKGNWIRGWGVKGTNDQWYYCGVLCDSLAIRYAEKRIPAELKTHPYKCRFIDTTTASPWRECYNTNHPMTRTESKLWKMKLLEYVSNKMNLVTGSETGHDTAVPYVHYFEGMLSLGPYRVPDAGRNIQKIWDEPPERVEKFQLGHRYRLPLWELVYHDCVVAQWYWGDYNNKLPSLWDKRDLFNALYGTPAMFMFSRPLWTINKERFVKSYKTTCPIARLVGYSEMLDHQFLTQNRDVQQTRFANGVVVTVNFGSTPFKLSDEITIPPMQYFVYNPATK